MPTPAHPELRGGGGAAHRRDQRHPSAVSNLQTGKRPRRGQPWGWGATAEKGEEQEAGSGGAAPRGRSQLAGTRLRPLLRQGDGETGRLQSPAPPLQREARGLCLSFLPATGPAQPSWPGTAGLNEDGAVSGVRTLLLPPPRADPGTTCPASPIGNH